MQEQQKFKTEEYAKRRRRVSIWKRIVGTMAGIVVFITTYMLILPAITATGDNLCGFTSEHTHGDQCFVTHETFQCVGGYDGWSHHTESCYEEALICNREIEERHIHAEENCTEVITFACNRNETAGHTHDDTCMDEEKLICTLEETEAHSHAESGCVESRTYSCNRDESEGHIHNTLDCYNRTYTCSNTNHHTQIDSCYQAKICNEKQHVHSDDCKSNEFTYVNSSNGLQVTLTMGKNYQGEASTYVPSLYDLKVEPITGDALINAVNTLAVNGKQLVGSDYGGYNISLVLKDDADAPNYTINGPYKLEITQENGFFSEVEAGDFIEYSFNYEAGSLVLNQDKSNVNGVTIDKLSETWNGWNNGAIVLARMNAPEGLRAGDYILKFNSIKDAFITDSTYTKYNTSNSPLGTAGSFHIVAFEKATLAAHTNGNILAKILDAGGQNFGTNGYLDELSYIQNYEVVRPVSASHQDHVLVLGSDTVIGFGNNNQEFTINGAQLTQPHNLVKDVETENSPFIDLERVESEVRGIADKLSSYPDENLEYISASAQQKDNSTLKLATPSSVGVLNIQATEVGNYLGGYVELDGFQSGSKGTVVINVNCSGLASKEITLPKALVRVDGELVGTNEVVEFSAGKVVWNFLNAEGVTITTQQMTGMVVAPGATVKIGVNLNGTVVADYIYVYAESHRTDFTGSIDPPTEPPTENEYYITLKKIEFGAVATTLPGAKFDLSKWDGTLNEGAGGWLKVNAEPLITGVGGTVMLHDLEQDTAYRLEEKEAPLGYQLDEEPYTFFWVPASSRETKPITAPNDFTGIKIENGYTLQVTNEPMTVVPDTTKLTIQKIWKSSDGSFLASDELADKSIVVEVYRVATKADQTTSETLYRTITLNPNEGWNQTIEGLPLTAVNDNGETLSYSYEVKETAVTEGGVPIVDGFTTTYASGSGYVSITNKSDTPTPDDFILPETGGSGIIPFRISGTVLVVLTGLVLILRRRKREVSL